MSTATHAAAPTRTPRRRAFRTSVTAVGVGFVAFLITACNPSAQEAVRQTWGDSRFDCASRVIQRESGWNPDAVSPGGGNIGLFQLNKTHATWIRSELGYTWNELTDPLKNARAAKRLSEKAHTAYGDGWQPWRLDGSIRPGGGCPA